MQEIRVYAIAARKNQPLSVSGKSGSLEGISHASRMFMTAYPVPTTSQNKASLRMATEAIVAMRKGSDIEC